MIRDSMIQWRDATELLVRVLDVEDDELREGVIQQTDQLLTKREQLQLSILPPFTEEEQVFGQELVQLENELEIKLKNYLQNIREDIGILQKKKGSAQAYIDPYNKVFRDGTFYDKKN